MGQGLTETLSLGYACVGVFCASLCYFAMAALIKAFGTERILRFFPPVVTGPMVIAIGLTLSGSAISSCNTNWLLAIIAIVIVIIASIWAKGIIKIIPILIGIIGSYLVAAVMGDVDFSQVSEAAWLGLPLTRDQTMLAVL